MHLSPSFSVEMGQKGKMHLRRGTQVGRKEWLADDYAQPYAQRWGEFLDYAQILCPMPLRRFKSDPRLC